jgi:hypothetical protein
VAVLSAGLDVDCGSFLPQFVMQAINDNRVTTQEVDFHLANFYRVRFRLGVFDSAQNQPYLQLGPSDVNSKAHKQLARRAAQESMVLLKNAKANASRALPLSVNLSIAVLGPNANAAQTMLGNYEGIPEHIVTVYEGIKARASPSTTVGYAQGCDINSQSTSGFAAACALAQQADRAVLVMGLDETIEYEGIDRVSIDLPGVQHQFIAAMAKCSKAPLVLVIVSGGSVDITAERDSPQIGAIIWAGTSSLLCREAHFVDLSLCDCGG